MIDRHTIGYPVIAAVAFYHLDLIAQIPAGCHIQFRKIYDFMDVKKMHKKHKLLIANRGKLLYALFTHKDMDITSAIYADDGIASLHVQLADELGHYRDKQHKLNINKIIDIAYKTE